MESKQQTLERHRLRVELENRLFEVRKLAREAAARNDGAGLNWIADEVKSLTNYVDCIELANAYDNEVEDE
jgi:hypothetical protein